jgi:hypothetical protein
MKGLKLLRSVNGPINPNTYWRRQPRKRCSQCGRRIRGPNHAAGHR